MYEGQGSVVTNQSGSGNDGMITGGTWTQLPNGLWYLSFDGEDDYLQIPDRDVLTFGDDASTDISFSEFMWIKIATGGDINHATNKA